MATASSPPATTPKETPVDARFGRWLALLVAIALVLRVAYVLVVERGDPLSGDGAYYHEAANLLADGLGFTEPYRYLHGAPRNSSS